MKKRTKQIIGAAGAAGVIAGTVALAGAAVVGRRLWNAMRMEDLRGKVVLITGGSRGLGLVLAEEYAQLGCNLVICGRHEDDLERATRHLEGFGVEVLAVPCDVGDREQVGYLVDHAKRRFGFVDVLVNNAGIISVGPVESQRVEDFQEAMDVMFWGTVYPTLELLPVMANRGTGHIVNITSIGGKVAVPHLLAYTSAKFAAVGFSEGLRAEVKKFGVNVLTVAPGLMRTGSYLNAQFKGKHRQEFSLFSLMGNSPLTSISARRAARQIVNAMRKRQPELIITWQAEMAAALHGVFPGIMADVLGTVNRMLPNAIEQNAARRFRGKDSETLVSRSPLTALGRRAAERYNQSGEVA
jgi:short-subunit dehydrogenase